MEKFICQKVAGEDAQDEEEVIVGFNRLSHREDSRIWQISRKSGMSQES